MSFPPRYTPRRPFPPLRFIPGRHPHPEKKGGYSYGHKNGLSEPLSLDSMGAHPDYLYALDLFNHHYFWEAHVWLEALWNELGRRGDAPDFLKALIKICAAKVKEEMKAPKEFHAHLARALELLKNIPPFYFGLDVTLVKNTLATKTFNSPLRLPEETLSLGGGCFWGVQHALSLLPGVLKATSGYQGGDKTSPSYEEVCQGHTGHIEVVCVQFVPSLLSLERLLQAFLLMHDPTQHNRQGPDVGSQYQSAIFCQNKNQLLQIQKFLKQASPRYTLPLATKVGINTWFYPAEEYHQDYLNKHPGGYCHISIDDVFERIRQGTF